MAETKGLLLNRVWRLFVQRYGFINEANRIVQSIISGYSDGVIREYLSGSDDQMWILIAEANPLLTLQAQPSGLLPSLQPPALHQLTSSRYIMPPSQPSDGSYHGMHAPNPQGHQLQWSPYIMHQFQPIYVSYHGMHAPNPPICQTGDFQSLHVGPSVFHRSGVPEVHNQMQGHYIMPQFQPIYGGCHGMHAPNLPIGQIGAFQSLNVVPSVLRCPPSSSTSHTMVCHVPEGHSQRQGSGPGSLMALETEIRAILIAERPFSVPIHSSPRRYLEMFGKLLLAEGCLTESERQGKAVCSLTCLVMCFRSQRVKLLKRNRLYYIALEEDALKYEDHLTRKPLLSEGCLMEREQYEAACSFKPLLRWLPTNRVVVAPQQLPAGPRSKSLTILLYQGISSLLEMSVKWAKTKFVAGFRWVWLPKNWSWLDIMGEPVVQTSDGTCSLCATVMCVEAQHRLLYENVHGQGSFPLKAEIAKLKHEYLRAGVLGRIDGGADTEEVICTAIRIQGIPTNKRAVYLTIDSYESFPGPDRSRSSSECSYWISAKQAARILYKRGPVIGSLFVSPKYYACKGDIGVYRGCPVRLRESFGAQKGVGWHAVVCVQYRFVMDGNLEIMIMDNHSPEGPCRWVRFNAFDRFILPVVRYPVDPRSNRRNAKVHKSRYIKKSWGLNDQTESIAQGPQYLMYGYHMSSVSLLPSRPALLGVAGWCACWTTTRIQEMAEIKELLLNRVRRLFVQRYGFLDEVMEYRIIQSIISGYSDRVIREYLSGSDDEMWILIAEANPLFTLQAQPSGLFPSLQPRALGHQLTSSRYIMPQSQPSDDSYHGMHAPNPQGHQLQWPRHIRPQFQPIYVSYHGMHAPNPPICQIGDFQSLNAGPSVFHGSGVPEMHNQMHGHYLGSLRKLDMEISVLLNTLGTLTYRGLRGEPLAIRQVLVAIEELPRLYRQKYWKPTLAEGCLTASEWDEDTGCSLTRLLMRLPSTWVFESQDVQYYISTHEEDARPRYLPPTRVYRNRSKKVYINIRTGRRLADREFKNYFEHIGPVIMVQTFCRDYGMFGFVCFLYTETPELVFKERKKCSFRGIKNFVKQYEEKHE